MGDWQLILPANDGSHGGKAAALRLSSGRQAAALPNGDTSSFAREEFFRTGILFGISS